MDQCKSFFKAPTMQSETLTSLLYATSKAFAALRPPFLSSFLRCMHTVDKRWFATILFFSYHSRHTVPHSKVSLRCSSSHVVSFATVFVAAFMDLILMVVMDHRSSNALITILSGTSSTASACCATVDAPYSQISTSSVVEYGEHPTTLPWKTTFWSMSLSILS